MWLYVSCSKRRCESRRWIWECSAKDGPVEFLNGTGVVCQNNNAYDTHFHATMCDASGNVFGGHIVKGYTPTLTTVDLIIFEIKDIEMLRVYDEETDLTQFLPE